MYLLFRMRSLLDVYTQKKLWALSLHVDDDQRNYWIRREEEVVVVVR